MVHGCNWEISHMCYMLRAFSIFKLFASTTPQLHQHFFVVLWLRRHWISHIQHILYFLCVLFVYLQRIKWIVCQVFNFSDVYCVLYSILYGILKPFKWGISRDSNPSFSNSTNRNNFHVFILNARFCAWKSNSRQSDSRKAEKRAEIEQCSGIKSVEFNAFHTIYLLPIREYFFFVLFCHIL